MLLTLRRELGLCCAAAPACVLCACAALRGFPIESPLMQEVQCAAHVQTRGGGRPMHFRAGDVTYLSSASRPPVIAVTQWTRAAQLSNFDNALLCSAFKFYSPPPVCRGAFLRFSPSLCRLKNVLNAARAQHRASPARCTFTASPFLVRLENGKRRILVITDKKKTVLKKNTIFAEEPNVKQDYTVQVHHFTIQY